MGVGTANITECLSQFNAGFEPGTLQFVIPEPFDLGVIEKSLLGIQVALQRGSLWQ